MDISPFKLERWYAKYEFAVPINISASCAPATDTKQLLELAGPEDSERYGALKLDYIESNGTPRLRRAIASCYETLEPDRIMVTTGASEAIFLLMNSLVSRGDELVVEWPIYQSLYQVAESLGATVKKVELEPGDGYRLPLEAFADACTPKTKLMVINSPHSPTGSVVDREELGKLYAIAERSGAYLVCDEVYRGAMHGDIDTIAGADLGPSAISIGDITKPYGLGGLRIGWVACHNAELLNKLSILRDYTTMCSAAPSEFLASIALEHRHGLLEEKVALAGRNLSVFEGFIKSESSLLSWIRPEGGFSAFVGYDLPITSEAFCKGLAEKEGVLLLPGAVFGREGHFRVGFGSEPSKFDEGLERLGRYIKSFQGGGIRGRRDRDGL